MPSTLSPQDLVKLAETNTDELLCSLYIPLDPSGIDLAAKKIQLKNAVRRLKAALTSESWEEERSSRLLAALDSLESHPLFIDPSSQGLAVLLPTSRPEAMRVLALSFRPEESLTLGEKYAVAPLLRLFGSTVPRTVLALAENGLRMLKGTAQLLDPVEIPEDFPRSRDEVTRFEDASGMDRHHNTQHRSGGGRVGGGLTYHGEGAKESVELEYSKRYFREIGAALSGMLSAHETVLLAGVHEQVALFRRLNPDLPLLAEEMTGNFEWQSVEVLREKALQVLGQVEQAENLRDVAQTRELGKDWWTVDPGQAEKAAREGRVMVLFIDTDSMNQARMEELVLEVLRHAGTVRMLEAGQLDTGCLARFRWSNDPGTKSPRI